MSTHKIGPGSIIPFPCWLWRSLDMSDINYQRKPEWVWEGEEYYSAAYILSNGFTHYSTNPPDQPPLGEPAPEGSLPVTNLGGDAQMDPSLATHPSLTSPPVSSDPTPAAPSLQSVAEGANDGFPVFSKEYRDGFAAGRNAQQLIDTAALTERDDRIGRLERGQLEYRDAVVRLSAEIGNLSEANAALRTRCEELERDKERLDWLERWHLSLSRLTAPDMSGLRFVGQYFNPGKEMGESGPSYLRIQGPTIRSAIDAARKEGQQAHEKGEGA